MRGDQTGCTEVRSPTSPAGQATGQECCIGCRTGPQPSGWRPWDARMEDLLCCATGLVFGPRPRPCTGRQRLLPPLDCGPKKPDPGQRMSLPCPRKLRPVALAEVLMNLTESCVVEQHKERIFAYGQTKQHGTCDAGCGADRARGPMVGSSDVHGLGERLWPCAPVHMPGGRATGLPSACSGVCVALGNL